MMNRIVIFGVLVLISSTITFSQKAIVSSPNQKLSIELYNQQGQDAGNWYLKVLFHKNKKTYEVIPQIKLGISCNSEDFTNNLKYLKVSKSQQIYEQYTAIHGKRNKCSNLANEVVISFENQLNTKFNLYIRAYNDGVAFKYELPENKGSYVVMDELTAYLIPDSTIRWLEKFDLSNEGLYQEMHNDSVQQNWCYPALFKSNNCWYLIHEADVNRNYCATKLSNLKKRSEYKITLPYSYEGEGEAQPTIKLPWKSPWRVIIIGSLANIVESTLVNDVSTPSKVENIDWIKPGIASWNYWSDNHGTRNYQTICRFADLAAAMDWPYTLLDWEWDSMQNGGNVEDAAKYILSKGVKPLLWYNSGMFKWITATPMDRMKTHENRVDEFTWLKKMGFVGVKIDFFLSEKQYMIDYYLDILEDAAEFEMMVYFHGCLVPRGWSRTYPHLMTYEAVRGAEWYNNGPELSTTAPVHNTILPFTRNVVGSMDYTPVTFTNSQYPHITSYGHELALSVLFESGIQHMADRPEGYFKLPDAALYFLKRVPNIWDETKLLDGYPGKDIIIARQRTNFWYLGGINGEAVEKIKRLAFSFLPRSSKYKLTLITDGRHDMDLSVQYQIVDQSSVVDIKMLRRGGFVAYLSPIN